MWHPIKIIVHTILNFLMSLLVKTQHTSDRIKGLGLTGWVLWSPQPLITFLLSTFVIILTKSSLMTCDCAANIALYFYIYIYLQQEIHYEKCDAARIVFKSRYLKDVCSKFIILNSLIKVCIFLLLYEENRTWE